MKIKVLVLFATLTLSCCTNKKDSLVGTYSRQEGGEKMYIELKSDSTAVLKETSLATKEVINTQKFIWHVEGNTLTMYDTESGKREDTPFTYNGTDLIVSDIKFTKE